MNSASKSLKIALFGCGKMGLQHIRAIQSIKNAELIAVADPYAKRETLKTLLTNEVKIFKSAEDLLKDKKPDVVHVCTPPQTHSKMALLALKYGVHVYVEKPFALTTKQANDVLSVADDSGLKVCAGHQLLYEEPGRKANELVTQLGRVVHVESYFSFRTVRRSPDGRAAMSPIEQLVDILPHPVYLLLHFLTLNLSRDAKATVEIASLKVESSGNVRAIIRCGDITGIMVVTLEGRPIESYVRVVGTNGNLFADFVLGKVIKHIGPGSSGISKVINPYSHAWQNIIGTTRALAKRIFGKSKSYPGLVELFKAFYDSLESGKPDAISTSSILETVKICEEIGNRLKIAEDEESANEEEKLKLAESKMKPPDVSRGGIMITGGTGLLGRAVASELRKMNWYVRVVARRLPPLSKRLPGVEYTVADLGANVSTEILNGISTVVHCAAETVGGKEAHQRNSIDATRNILNAMAKAGIKKYIHISSIAVLKTSKEMGIAINEDTPLDLNNEDRGPYVWGKAESESLAIELCEKSGIQHSIIRPGPLVDFNLFEAPGRLGREVGPLFVAMGSKRSKLSLCDVQIAANVIRYYVENVNSVPQVLNLIDPDAPTREELISKLKIIRPDLQIIWVPSIAIRLISPVLTLLQRVLLPGRKPVNIGSAFASEEYKTDLVGKIIKQAENN